VGHPAYQPATRPRQGGVAGSTAPEPAHPDPATRQPDGDNHPGRSAQETDGGGKQPPLTVATTGEDLGPRRVAHDRRRQRTARS
jgi:hypothetical protein